MRTILIAAAALVLGAATARAEVRFKQITVDPLFRSEGVAIGDVNRDGKNDVCVGDLWYEAPGWKPHEIRKPRKPNRGGYTQAFAVYSDDFNKDGWVDFLVIPFHGNDAKWYENPKGKTAGHWTARVAFRKTGNETRIYPDLFRDGKRVFLMSVEEAIAWVEVPANPTGPWTVHKVGGKEKWTHRFAHGLGVGDVNGDGRNDILVPGGWYEQPSEGRDAVGDWPLHRTPLTDSNTADIFAVDSDGDGRNDIWATSAHRRGIFFSKQTGTVADPAFKRVRYDFYGNHELTTEKRKNTRKSIYETHSLNFVDINGDGKKDLVTGRRFFAHGFRKEKAGDPADVYWIEIKPQRGRNPRLVAHHVSDQTGIGAQFVTEDFNGDGKIDIIVSGRKGVYIHLQQ